MADAGREAQQTDVLVIFGITGDLAKVMTFRSLYRLEKRGLLDCPIVGVAVDDWTVDQLVERARESIVGTGEQLDEEVFERLAARLSYVQGDFADAAMYGRVGEAIEGRDDAGLLPRDPALPLRDGRQGARRGGADQDGARRRREAVRARPGLRARARRGAAPVHRRVPALQDRPLPREDGDRGDHPPAVRERDARADLEPELRLVASRSRWPRTSGSRTAATSTIRSGRCATSSSITSCRSSRMCAMEAPARGDPQTIKDAQLALFRAVKEADPAHYVRGQYDGYRSIDGVAPDSTTETYAALRLEIENWRWAGVPFFIRTGKRLPVDADRAPARVQASARGSGSRRSSDEHRAEPARREARSVDRDQARSSRRIGRTAPARSSSTWSSPPRAARARRPYEVLLHAAMVGQTQRFTRQDAVEETWRVMQPLLDSPPPVHPYAPGSWGPEGGGRAGRRARSLARPVDRVMTKAATETEARPRAPPRRRRSHRSPTTRSCRTATPARSWRRTARSTGSASLVRLAERLRQPPRPSGRVLPVRPVRHQPSGRARVRAGDERARDELEDAERAGSPSATR